MSDSRQIVTLVVQDVDGHDIEIDAYVVEERETEVELEIIPGPNADPEYTGSRRIVVSNVRRPS